MSEIKVNSIKGVGASTAAITVDNTAGTCTANITNRNNRNLWINGACLVNQRGSSSTSGGYQTVDRISFNTSGQDEALTQAQADVASGTTPYTLGLRKAFKVTNGNQTSGAGAADYAFMFYGFEAQDLVNSGWNYNSASSYVTLSFWIKSSVAKSFKGYFMTNDGSDYSYAFDTGSLSADTWTKVTKTISGNSNITINNDNGLGLGLYFWPYIGTNYTASSATEDAWVAHSGSARTKDDTTTWWTTNDATLEFTGFQFEVGSVGTDFEHRSFAQELALCQRYFYMHASGAFPLSNTDRCPIGHGYGYTSTDGYVFVTYPVQMRTNPSLYKVVGTDYFNFAYSNNNAYPNNILANRVSNQVCELSFYEGASWGQNDGGMFRTYNTATRIGFNAEL